MKKKKTTNKPKYYIIMDSDEDIICQGNWDEVKEALDEIMEEGNDDENKELIADFTLYELNNGKKLKFIPLIPATVEM